MAGLRRLYLPQAIDYTGNSDIFVARDWESVERSLRPAQDALGYGCVKLLIPGNIVMPKLKTHKGASKRFKKTGTGKVVRQHAFARHILTSKARKRKNKLHTSVVADDSDQAKLQRMIPY
jgi:large subunit ribosomal protein L35